MLRSPVAALLWEHWRLTRAEAAWRLCVGVVAGSAVLALADDGATYAVGILFMLYAWFWVSIAKLAGGKFMDGYKPGFPLHLLYTRPMPTAVFVGVAMAYDAISCAAMYLGSAAILEFAFGQPLPLLSVTMWILAFHLLCTFVQWSSRSRVLQYLGTFAIGVPFVALPMHRADWSLLQLEFSPAEHALMAFVGLVAFGLTVAGVSRQRHGDPPLASPWLAGLTRFPPLRVGRFRVPCPTSSATRAQIWSDLRSSGLPVLTIGLALAIVIPLLFEITTRLDLVLSGFYARPATRMVAVVAAMFSLPAVLILGGNTFGIRARQGRTHASVFEATQASGTARMAGLKVLVRSVCLLAALAAVGTSIWTSASTVPFDVLEDNDTFIEKARSPVSGGMRAIEGAVRGMQAYELLALAFVTAIAVAVMVASRAALPALRARYPRRVNIAGSLLLLYGMGLVLRAPNGQGGDGLDVLLMDALFGAAPWITAAAIALATVYLFWRVLAEQLLTLRQALLAVLIAVAFGAAWVTVLHAGGVQLSGMPAIDGVRMLSPVMLPLLASVLAPWSLSRVRHT
jgi:hypothetical protein